MNNNIVAIQRDWTRKYSIKNGGKDLVPRIVRKYHEKIDYFPVYF